MPEALSFPYCTVEDVQREIRNTDDVLEDAIIAAINQASRFVDAYCETDFLFHDHSSSAYTVPRKRVIADSIFLPWPIITLTEVVSDEDSFDMSTDVYYGVGGREIQSLDGDFADYPCTLVVTVKGTFGYESDSETEVAATLPPGIRRATALIASAWSGRYQKEQVSVDGVVQQLLLTDVPPEAFRLLKRFKQTMNRTF